MQIAIGIVPTYGGKEFLEFCTSSKCKAMIAKQFASEAGSGWRVVAVLSKPKKAADLTLRPPYRLLSFFFLLPRTVEVL